MNTRAKAMKGNASNGMSSTARRNDTSRTIRRMDVRCTTRRLNTSSASWSAQVSVCDHPIGHLN